LKTIKTISAYYKEIRVRAPKHASFDIGRHEDNLATMKLKQEQPIKHELYSISLISLHNGGTGFQINKKEVKFRLFIISPFKEISWDITGQKLKGIYIIFDREFIRSNPLWTNFLLNFPFFKLDNLVTDDIPNELMEELNLYFEKIYKEYNSAGADPFEIIKGYVHIVLLLLRRHFTPELAVANDVTVSYKILSAFENLLLESLEKTEVTPSIRKPSYYAANLNLHVNHLNSTLKQLTGKTTSELIYDHITHNAGLLIQQTNIPVKELASRFHFSDPTHFISFFKKQTGLTPKQYKLHLST
jgi:AraC family transcriptional activator of pobA